MTATISSSAKDSKSLCSSIVPGLSCGADFPFKERPGHTNESLDERRSQAYNQPFSLPGESREIMLSITATAVCRGKVKPIAFLGTVNTLVPASTTISGMFLFL